MQDYRRVHPVYADTVRLVIILMQRTLMKPKTVGYLVLVTLSTRVEDMAFCKPMQASGQIK